MSTLFNAEEIFAIAIQVESNGAAFYRKTAAKQPKPQAKFLLELAGMEDDHQRTFTAMRDAYLAAAKRSATADLAGEGGLYLAAIASGYKVEGAPSVADKLTGRESLADILALAVTLEKESILFYVGMLDVVPPDLGRNKLEAIIAEEKRHIVTLSRKLREIML
jgi:rubrerythrin